MRTCRDETVDLSRKQWDVTSSHDFIFHTWNSQILYLQEIMRVDSSVSFTLVFMDKEIDLCREQSTFSNSPLESEEGLVLDPWLQDQCTSLLQAAIPGLFHSMASIFLSHKKLGKGKLESWALPSRPSDCPTWWMKITSCFMRAMAEVSVMTIPHLLTLKFKPSIDYWIHHSKKSTYLLKTYYTPGIRLSISVFHLIFIKTLWGDHAHFVDGDTKMCSNLPKVLPQASMRFSRSAWRWSPYSGHLHRPSSHCLGGTLILDNWSTHCSPPTVRLASHENSFHQPQGVKWFPLCVISRYLKGWLPSLSY